IVSGAIIAALLLPPSGQSSVLPLVIAITYFLFALLLLRKSRFNSDF
ncbi:MAG TPA: MFS transporter, partial [Actinobacteria bacterium]|nr:MFS transporter [Actinomycetota bacterium]